MICSAYPVFTMCINLPSHGYPLLLLLLLLFFLLFFLQWVSPYFFFYLFIISFWFFFLCVPCLKWSYLSIHCLCECVHFRWFIFIWFSAPNPYIHIQKIHMGFVVFFSSFLFNSHALQLSHESCDSIFFYSSALLWWRKWKFFHVSI